jgi:SP family sugar:H+ symporter-like MFS transporter
MSITSAPAHGATVTSQAPEAPPHGAGKVVMLSAVAAIGGFLFGFDTAVINGGVSAIQERFGLSPAIIGLTVACALIGSAIGAWFSGSLADRIGRVRVMVIAAVVFAVSSLGAGLAFSVWDLVLWRFLSGIGVGIASVIAPTYIAEVAPAELRGRLGSLQQLAIVVGIFVALLVDAFLARAAGGAGQVLWLGLSAWRWMFLAGIVPSVAYGVLALQIPESPRYLVAKGRLEAAAVVLRQTLGLVEIASKVEQIALSMKLEEPRTMRVLRGPRAGLLGIVWVGIALSMLQQLVGINVIFYYSTSLWRSVGLSEADALTISVVTSVTNVLVTLVAIALVDKLGRRPLLLVGSLGMAASLAAMAMCFSRAQLAEGALRLPAPYGTIALVAANAYVVFFGVSWGPVVWVLLGEMFSNRVRAPALALAAAAQWMANFLVTVSFPVLAARAGLTVSYGIFAAFAAVSFVFVQRHVRETRGKELEDMKDE